MTTQTFLPGFATLYPPPGLVGWDLVRWRYRRCAAKLEILDLLHRRSNRSHDCYQSNAALASAIGVTERMFSLHLAEMERDGVVIRLRSPGLARRKIHLIFLDGAAKPTPTTLHNKDEGDLHPRMKVTFTHGRNPPSPMGEGDLHPSSSQVLEEHKVPSTPARPLNSIPCNSEVEDNVNVRVRGGEEDPGPVEADPEALVSVPLPADPPSGGEVPAARDDGSPSEEEIDRSSIEIWRHWVRTGHPFAGIGAKALRDRGLTPEPGPEALAPVEPAPPTPVVPPPAPAPASRPAPAPRPDTETILRRLRNPLFPNSPEEAATRLAEALDDWHSLPWLRRTCREVREGTIRFATLILAFRAAMAARTSGGDPRKVFAATITRARKTDPGSP